MIFADLNLCHGSVSFLSAFPTPSHPSHSLSPHPSFSLVYFLPFPFPPPLSSSVLSSFFSWSIFSTSNQGVCLQRISDLAAAVLVGVQIGALQSVNSLSVANQKEINLRDSVSRSCTGEKVLILKANRYFFIILGHLQEKIVQKVFLQSARISAITEHS